jgi:hypothetical protein
MGAGMQAQAGSAAATGSQVAWAGNCTALRSTAQHSTASPNTALPGLTSSLLVELHRPELITRCVGSMCLTGLRSACAAGRGVPKQGRARQAGSGSDR